MSSIIKISGIDSLYQDNLVILDDELGGLSLALKSDKIFNNVDFKFKKIDYKNHQFGVILLKSDCFFYSCYVSLQNQSDLEILKKLLRLDSFNLVLFMNSNEQKVYRIENKLEYKAFIDNYSTNILDMPENLNELINELNLSLSLEELWKN